jgi:hypothetical protein
VVRTHPRTCMCSVVPFLSWSLLDRKFRLNLQFQTPQPHHCCIRSKGPNSGGATQLPPAQQSVVLCVRRERWWFESARERLFLLMLIFVAVLLSKRAREHPETARSLWWKNHIARLCAVNHYSLRTYQRRCFRGATELAPGSWIIARLHGGAGGSNPSEDIKTGVLPFFGNHSSLIFSFCPSTHLIPQPVL